ncbi:N-acetylmuramoyl-L-alanine amidase [Gracilibacillus kekensis]|uniref:N-acetylmuramoyl-L-alanine amidase n=1 Tax=Gracilibacillus kekensis TaxID=1027249 RepID=A0A1M7K6E8_9BACI|nr:N-acetylmuramoyl-L-alanine amidase [Gracilibacillus kekensis]SHM60869.1 N-acetylmuramoyl-L-alanine amidase [Gracilibacillus kekensis]
MKYKKIIITYLFAFISFLVIGIQVEASKRIVIDPGHGGWDPGAVNYNVQEKDINLELSRLIKDRLDPFTEVILTRNGDEYLSLEERADFANVKNADLFLSIHHDSNYYSSAQGISTHFSSYRANIQSDDYYVKYNGKTYDYLYEKKVNGESYIFYSDNGKTKKAHVNNIIVYDKKPFHSVVQESQQLSLDIADALASLGFKKRYTSSGSKDHNLYVTRHTNMASILIENGFTSNLEDLFKIKNNQEQMALKIANSIINYYKLGTPVITSFGADKTSPQRVDERIIVNAKATSGEPVEYKFWQENVDTGEWTLLQNYSSDTNIGWEPSVAGNYKLVVQVREQGSTKSYQTYKSLHYVIEDPKPTITKFEGDKASPQSINERIIVNAKATNENPVEYKFWQKNLDTGEWTLIQNYSTDTNIGWEPTIAGNYQLVVHVREQGSTTPYQSYKTLNYVISKPNITEFEADKASPQLINERIIVNAKATSNNPVEYKFWQENLDTGEWTLIQNYSTDTNIGWEPSVAGNYKLVVHVREQGTTEPYQSYKTLNYVIEKPKPVISSFKADKASPQPVNERIMVSAQATDSNPVEYKFWQENLDTGEWTLIQNYSSDTNIEWNPSVAGNYKLVVHVREQGSTEPYQVYSTISYTVDNLELSITSFEADKASPQPVNERIIVNAKATSKNPVEYKFWQKNIDTGEWILIQNYSSDTNIGWKPSVAGNYKLVVHVREQGSTNAYQAYEVLTYKIN